MPAEAPARTFGNELYLKNWVALQLRDPQLAGQLQRLEERDLPALESTASGHVTVKRPTPGGGEIYLHSMRDPLAQARQWAARTITADKFCYLIEGLGLGYHVRALADDLTGDAAIVVIEPDLPVLRQALACADLSRELADGRLVFLTDSRKDHVHDRLSRVSTAIIMGTHLACHQPSVQISPGFFAAVRPAIREWMNYTKTSVVTLLTNAHTTCRNVARNLPRYLATPPIDVLKGRFTGIPAIIVSAGPSLSRNADLLPQAKGRAILIATQTTFKPLLERSVAPDFVCSLDFHAASRDAYEGLDDVGGVHLVAEPKASSDAIDAFKGPVSLLSNDFAALCLGPVHPARDGLPAGGCVAHLAFYLAEYAGCDPIILVGQDLALTGGVYYAPGTALHAAWEAQSNRFCTMETREWEHIARYRPILRRVRGADGQELYTEELMLNYLEQFERDFGRTRARVINATEGGLPIRGAANMPLRQALAELCPWPIDPRVFDYRRTTRWFDPALLPAGRRQIEQLIEEIRTIASLCSETLPILAELGGLLDQPAEFNRRVGQIEHLHGQVRAHNRAYDVICAGAQMAQLRRFVADQKLKASGAAGTERARRQLDRDREFVGTLQAEAQRMAATLEEALPRFDAAISEYAARVEAGSSGK